MKLLSLHFFTATLLLHLLTPFDVWGIDKKVSFRSEVAPVLLKHCLSCHGDKVSEGGYRIDTYQRLIALADSEVPGVVPGKVDESLLYLRILNDDHGDRMPLDKPPVSKQQLMNIERWIAQGAEFDAVDPSAELATIVPPRKYATPPQQYARTLPVTAMVFDPAGERLLTAGYTEINVWNAEDGDLVRRIPQSPERIYSLCFDPSGKFLLAGGGVPGRLGEVRIFDLIAGELDDVIGAWPDVVLDVVVSPDGKQVAIACADKNIYIYDMPTRILLQTLSGHSDWVLSLDWSADSKKLATGSRDKTAKVYDLETGSSLVTFAGHNAPVRGVAFAADTALVFSSDTKGICSLWKMEDAVKVKDVQAALEDAYCLESTSDFLWMSSRQGVRQFSKSDNKVLRNFGPQKDWTLSLACDPKQERIASGGFDGRVIIWNVADGKKQAEFLAAPGFVVE